MIKCSKKIVCIPFLLLTMFVSSSFSSDDYIGDLKDDFVIEQTAYGPFKRTDPSKELFFTYHYYGYNSFDNVQEKISIKKGLNTYSSYNLTFSSHKIERNGEYKISFYFKPSYIDSYNGCVISLTLYDKVAKTDIHVWECKLSEKNEEKHIYKANLNTDLTHTEYTSIIDFTKEGDYIEEKFDFSEFPLTFGGEYYFDLNFTSLSFIYLSDYKFITDDIQIQFNDTYNLFPYLSKADNGKRIIHVGYSRFGNKIILINQVYYVDPTCSIMSETKYSYYVQTNHFYLPRGKEKEMNSYTYNIIFMRAGRAKNSYHLPLRFIAGRKYFGSCSNSDYCITGGVYND